MQETDSARSEPSSTPKLPIVHMFWHGAPLSRVEQLCMASFVACGHVVNLYAYDELQDIPTGVSRVDAQAILPRSALFRHPKTNSLAQFADWFRYRVLHACGGIWADTDVVCLQPLQYSCSEVYAWQDDAQINNAILGLPQGHELAEWMAECCEHPNRVLPYDDMRSRWRKWKRRWLRGNRRGNVKWGEYGPAGFTAAARHLGYVDKALPPAEFYPVAFKEWYRVFDASPCDWESALRASRAIHLWNEMMRRESGFDKNAVFPHGSLFEQLWRRYVKSDS